MSPHPDMAAVWGSEHHPTIIDALIHRDCIEEACGHGHDCPTHAVMVCSECQDGEPDIGMVGTAQEWPCDHARPEPETGRDGGVERANGGEAMSQRRARLVFEPLTDWNLPAVRHEKSPFTARWPQTRDVLLREADALGATLVVIELDLQRADLRQDGEIRANARLASGKVRLSLDSRLGPMRYACDRYHAGAMSWQANARAIALTLEALRTVERYGAVHSAEQYQGFMALPAGTPSRFTTADEALRWVRQQAGAEAATATPRAAYRAAVRRLHPDFGGDPEGWARLDEAKQLLESAGLL